MHIAVVDTGSSVSYLFNKLKELGAKVTVVHTYMLDYTSSFGKKLYFPELAHHVVNIRSPEEIPAAITQLKALGVDYIICGYDHSMGITDQLAASINPQYVNNPTTSLWRSDKYHMQEALKKAGLPAIKQVLLYPEDSIETLQEKTKSFTYPAVLKPTQSAGSVGVFFINDFAELIKIMQQSALGYGGLKIHEFILQEQLIGDEYIVDSVSFKGQHIITSVQKYNKVTINSRPIYRWIDIVDNADPITKIAGDFVKGALTATGLDYAFGHTEIMITDQGPYLLEINPRISGAAGVINKLCEYAYGYGQPLVLIKSLTDLKAFSAMDKAPAKLQMHARALFLYTWNTKIMKGINQACFEHLPSYKQHHCWPPQGEEIKAPEDLTHTIATIILAHKDPAQIEADTKIILSCEQEDKLF